MLLSRTASVKKEEDEIENFSIYSNDKTKLLLREILNEGNSLVVRSDIDTFIKNCYSLEKIASHLDICWVVSGKSYTDEELSLKIADIIEKHKLNIKIFFSESSMI